MIMCLRDGAIYLPHSSSQFDLDNTDNKVDLWSWFKAEQEQNKVMVMFHRTV